jgi:hypothetical protein
MQLTTVNHKFVLLEFKGQEKAIKKLSKETRKWISDMMDQGLSWGGFFILDKNGKKKWGGSWDVKSKCNENKWKKYFKRTQSDIDIVNKKMLSLGWLKINKVPPENTPILIAFKEYGRELNRYKAKESIRRGIFYYRPDYDGKTSNNKFYQPDYWMLMPAIAAPKK